MFRQRTAQGFRQTVTRSLNPLPSCTMICPGQNPHLLRATATPPSPAARFHKAAGPTFLKCRPLRLTIGALHSGSIPLARAANAADVPPPQPIKRLVQYFAIEKNQGVQRLVLRGHRHVFMRGEMREKSLDLWLAHFLGMSPWFPPLRSFGRRGEGRVR